jgi:hypothetical protein
MYSGGLNNISLEMFKPKSDWSETFEFLNTVWFISGRHQANDRLSVIWTIPILNLDVAQGWTSFSDKVLIGNPYLELEYKRRPSDGHHTVFSRLGIQLPVTTDDDRHATEMSFFTAFDRFEAFIPDLVTISAGSGFHYVNENGFSSRVNLGGAFMKPIMGDDGSDLFIDYNVAVWFAIGRATLGAGFSGRMNATETGLPLSERSAHQLGYEISYRFGNFKPSVHMRIPIDQDLRDVVKFVYGFKLDFDVSTSNTE